MKLLLVDNYDSFTYNLHHYLTELGLSVQVVFNDALNTINPGDFQAIVISPGPGLPAEAGDCMPLIAEWVERIPMLGICLGAQALALHFGGEIYQQEEVAHGLARTCERQGESWLLAGIAPRFKVGLYHSWAIHLGPSSPFCATAQRLDRPVLMAFEKPNNAVAGLQFHPESIMTEGGKIMLQNWLRRVSLMSGIKKASTF